MSWDIEFLKKAEEDFKKLDGSQRIVVLKALKKVAENPLPDYEGGYGKPLANKNQAKLAGLLKIKIKSHGIRIVYKLEYINNKMLVIVIGMRADNEVYEEAAKRVGN